MQAAESLTDFMEAEADAGLLGIVHLPDRVKLNHLIGWCMGRAGTFAPQCLVILDGIQTLCTGPDAKPVSASVHGHCIWETDCHRSIVAVQSPACLSTCQWPDHWRLGFVISLGAATELLDLLIAQVPLALLQRWSDKNACGCLLLLAIVMLKLGRGPTLLHFKLLSVTLTCSHVHVVCRPLP